MTSDKGERQIQTPSEHIADQNLRGNDHQRTINPCEIRAIIYRGKQTITWPFLPPPLATFIKSSQGGSNQTSAYCEMTRKDRPPGYVQCSQNTVSIFLERCFIWKGMDTNRAAHLWDSDWHCGKRKQIMAPWTNLSPIHFSHVAPPLFRVYRDITPMYPRKESKRV